MNKSELAIAFGKKLREIRVSNRVSQDDLALISDIDRSYIGRLERGEANVTLQKIYQIADCLECDPRDLLP